MTAPSIPNGSISNSETADVTKLTANDNALLDALTDGSKALTVESVTATNLTASGLIKSADGSASAPGVSFSNDTNTGIYRIGADNIGVTTAGTKVMDIGSTGVITLPKQSGFSAYQSSGSQTTCVKSTSTTIIFDTELFDVASEFNATTGVFTAGVAGIYLATWQVMSDSTAWLDGESWSAYLSVNDDDLSNPGLSLRGNYFEAPENETKHYVSGGSVIVSLSATNTLRIKVYHDHGSNIDTDISGYDTYFSVHKIA